MKRLRSKVARLEHAPDTTRNENHAIRLLVELYGLSLFDHSYFERTRVH